TGATGYIGGSVLDTLVKEHPEYEITILLRNIPPIFHSQYPNVKIVEGDFDDVDLISATAAESDIVVHNGNTKHEAALRAHVAGLLRSATPSAPRFLIRLGGTSSIADWADPTYYGETNPKVWSDIDDIDDIKSLPDTALHRNMEKIIEAAAAEHGDCLKCAIICSCGVYGAGRGPGNKQSGLIPMYWAQIQKTGRAFYANSGGNTRSWVHIDDLVKIYLKLVEAAVARGGGATWGREGYYFTATQEWSQLDLAKATGRVLKKNKLIEDEEPLQLSIEVIKRMRPGKSSFALYGVYVFACNTRTRSDRARKTLGYVPTSADIWAHLEDDLMAAVRSKGPGYIAH
ncbi:hypothetical protein S40288_08567, partial [Stachybotrys chartarum IBT 40288]